MHSRHREPFSTLGLISAPHGVAMYLSHRININDVGGSVVEAPSCTAYASSGPW